MNIKFGPVSPRCVRTLIGAAIVAAAVLGPPAGATSVVAPNALGAAEGDTNNCIPVSGCLGTNRYQQVFASSQFGAFGGPQAIIEIAFRLDGEVGPTFAHLFTNVSIGLSTTTAAPDGLSSTFANNRGADFTVVRSGPLALAATRDGSAVGPQAFDIVIALTTPFVYDPGAGNLLLDWQNFGAENFLGGPDPSASVDASFVLGDSVSRLYGLGADDVSGSADTLGLVAQFRTPEPGSALLCGAALLAMLRRWRWNCTASAAGLDAIGLGSDVSPMADLCGASARVQRGCCCAWSRSSSSTSPGALSPTIRGA